MTATLDAERALVGAILAGHRDPDDILAMVRGADFQDPNLEIVWAAIDQVYRSGKKPEPIAVRAALPEQGARLPGGPVFLADLQADAPNVASASYYAERVRDAATRRRIGTAAQRIAQMAQQVDDVSQLADGARSEMDKALDTAVVHEVQRVAAVLPEVAEIAEHGHQQGIDTPWEDITRITRGLRPGRLIVVGARPGVGKSVMGTNLALHVVTKHQRAALICSMEMSAVEVTQRVVSNHASIPLGSLDGGEMTALYWERFARSSAELVNGGLFVEGDSKQTMSSIRAAVSRIRKERGDLSLIVVDYLQLIEPRDLRLNKNEQIGEISRGLKILAGETGTTVVAMAQLNRAPGARAGGKPTLFDLRDSGSIEQDADIVILLHREAPAEGPPSTYLDALIEKNRSGAMGVTSLQIQGHYARLIDAHQPPSPPAYTLPDHTEPRRLHAVD